MSPNMVNLKRSFSLMNNWWPDNLKQKTKVLPHLRILAIISLIVITIRLLKMINK